MSASSSRRPTKKKRDDATWLRNALFKLCGFTNSDHDALKALAHEGIEGYYEHFVTLTVRDIEHLEAPFEPEDTTAGTPEKPQRPLTLATRNQLKTLLQFHHTKSAELKEAIDKL